MASKRSPELGSEVEEDSLVLPLKSDVEGVAVVAHISDERPTAVLGYRAQHRVSRVRFDLVAEVDASDDPVEQPAREHRDVEVRCLQCAAGKRHPTGLEHADRPLTGGAGGAAPEAAE